MDVVVTDRFHCILNGLLCKLEAVKNRFWLLSIYCICIYIVIYNHTYMCVKIVSIDVITTLLFWALWMATLPLSIFCRIWSPAVGFGVFSIYMMTSSNGNTFRVTGRLCGEWWPPLTQASDAELWFFYFDARPNKRLSSQSSDWWFETPSCSLWRQCNARTVCKCFQYAKWMRLINIRCTIGPAFAAQVIGTVRESAVKCMSLIACQALFCVNGL